MRCFDPIYCRQFTAEEAEENYDGWTLDFDGFLQSKPKLVSRNSKL